MGCINRERKGERRTLGITTDANNYRCSYGKSKALLHFFRLLADESSMPSLILSMS